LPVLTIQLAQMSKILQRVRQRIPNRDPSPFSRGDDRPIDSENMYTQIATLSFSLKLYAFNGTVAEADGFGVIIAKSDCNQVFGEETVVSLIRLGQVLRPIHIRLLAEGYNVPVGKSSTIAPEV